MDIWNSNWQIDFWASSWKLKESKCGQESSEWFNQLNCAFVIKELWWITAICSHSCSPIHISTDCIGTVVKCAINIWNAVLLSLIVARIKSIVRSLISEHQSAIGLCLNVLWSISIGKTLPLIGYINYGTAAVIGLAWRILGTALSCCTVWSTACWKIDHWGSCHGFLFNIYKIRG